MSQAPCLLVNEPERCEGTGGGDAGQMTVGVAGGEVIFYCQNNELSVQMHSAGDFNVAGTWGTGSGAENSLVEHDATTGTVLIPLTASSLEGHWMISNQTTGAVGTLSFLALNSAATGNNTCHLDLEIVPSS